MRPALEVGCVEPERREPILHDGDVLCFARMAGRREGEPVRSMLERSDRHRLDRLQRRAGQCRPTAVTPAPQQPAVAVDDRDIDLVATLDLVAARQLDNQRFGHRPRGYVPVMADLDLDTSVRRIEGDEARAI